MNVRHLIAEQVLLDGELRPAHLEITEEGTIRRIHRLPPGAGAQRAAVVRATDISGGEGMQVLKPGLVVLPGVVDTHVHLNDPGNTRRETLATGTMAAALGGATTLVDMPVHNRPATTTAEALRTKAERAAGRITVDVGFWGGLTPTGLDHLEDLAEAGALGFFATLVSGARFDALSPAQLREAMTRIRRTDRILAVHAEDSRTIARATAAQPPRRRLTRYSHFAACRPSEAEALAVAGLIDAVRETGCPTHVVHLSSAAALKHLRTARAEGLPITAETCPHYLCFAAEEIPAGAANYVCLPPIREAADREALWEGLDDGTIDVVTSAHSPAALEEKPRHTTDLRTVRPGISGLQVSFAAVAAAAARRGIGLARVSQWMAQVPARLMNLARKGAITPGRDADLVIYDPDQAHVVSGSGLAHQNPSTAYDGMEIRGTVVASMLRGTELFSAQDPSTVLTQDGKLLGFNPADTAHATATPPVRNSQAVGAA
ncbi:allantoinase AllB [Nesterenkonia alba]|uniref:allantoinase AllB n=1 Tax=Nesterenkonia alba TaxID=515814 RepID=UPI0003B48BC9|nr:allantoinase AllB [Nesterenkonia alba]